MKRNRGLLEEEGNQGRDKEVQERVLERADILKVCYIWVVENVTVKPIVLYNQYILVNLNN